MADDTAGEMLDGKPFRMRFPHLGDAPGDEIPWTDEDEAASDAAWDEIAAQKTAPEAPASTLMEPRSDDSVQLAGFDVHGNFHGAHGRFESHGGPQQQRAQREVNLLINGASHQHEQANRMQQALDAHARAHGLGTMFDRMRHVPTAEEAPHLEALDKAMSRYTRLQNDIAVRAKLGHPTEEWQQLAHEARAELTQRITEAYTYEHTLPQVYAHALDLRAMLHRQDAVSMREQAIGLASQHGLPVVADDAARHTLATLLPHASDALIGNMMGARPGDVLHITKAGEHLVQVELRPRDNGRQSEAYIVRERGRVELQSPTVRNDEERTAASGREVVRGLLRMRAAGVDQVKGTAYRARGEDWNGYSTWARLGFQGSIPRHLLAAVDAHFGEHLTRVEQIMARPGGAAWWKANGATYEGRFDLRDPAVIARLTRLAGDGWQVEE